MKKLFAGLVAISVFPLQVLAFTDISMTNYLYPGVSYAVEKGIVKGYADGSFGINNAINRVEALKMILTAAEVDILDSGEQKFADVPTGVWFTKYVNYAASMGIISGSGGAFSPGRTVNRAEFIKMMIKGFGVDPSRYLLNVKSTDVAEGAWFAPYLDFAVKFKILAQDGEGKVYPEKVVTRGEATYLLYNILRNGRGLKPQTLLNLGEDHLVWAIKSLEVGKIEQAQVSIDMSKKFIVLALELVPQNKIVLAADKTTEAVRNLVKAYISAEAKQIDEVISVSKSAWRLADEAGHLNPEQVGMAEAIKELAHGLAVEARKAKELLEAQADSMSETPAEAPLSDMGGQMQLEFGE